MTLSRKERIYRLLKGIETGDPASVAVVNEEKYIQHNPQTHEGSEGLAALFKRLSQTSPRVNIVRLFEDGDFVFGHTEYDFADRNIGFEIFRFEDGQAVEHWDNIQIRQGPNVSGNSMVDGAAEITDHDRTEKNRAIAHAFVNEVLIQSQLDKLESYVAESYVEHNPHVASGVSALRTALLVPESASGFASGSASGSIRYETNHRILAEGNFVLSVCEGSMGGAHSSFFDLYRFEHDKIVEHWDTTEKIPPKNEWKNDNGKF